MTKGAASRGGSRIGLQGPMRGKRRRAAVIALTGATRRDLTRALALAAEFDASPLGVAVDGGLAAFRALRRRPDLFVGDLDSSPRPPAGVSSTIYPTAKDFSDFAGALGAASLRGANVAVVAGLVGGRLDHEWANVLEAGAAAPRFAAILAPSDRGLLVVTASTASVSSRSRSLVSLFALGGPASVTLEGVKWPLARRRLPPGSLGLSNVAGRSLRLTVHSGVAALVFPIP